MPGHRFGPPWLMVAKCGSGVLPLAALRCLKQGGSTRARIIQTIHRDHPSMAPIFSSRVNPTSAARCSSRLRRHKPPVRLLVMCGGAGMVTAWPRPARCVGLPCTDCVRCTADMLTVVRMHAVLRHPSMIILLPWSWWPQRDVFCTGTGGRATSAQAQALCRDAPPKLWIVARAHAVLHCSTLLVAHIKSEFAKCTFAEVSQTRPLQASAASACTDRRAHTAYLCVCVDVA